MTFLCCISLQHQQKVAVLGAAGGIGQPMSLLMKESPAISHLTLYDIVNTPGRQFKPAFAENRQSFPLEWWGIQRQNCLKTLLRPWEKNIIFPKRICLELGGGGLFEGSRKIFKQGPSLPFENRSQANYEVTVQSQWGMWFSGALSLNQWPICNMHQLWLK